jgi:hypothetical protein
LATNCGSAWIARLRLEHSARGKRASVDLLTIAQSAGCSLLCQGRTELPRLVGSKFKAGNFAKKGPSFRYRDHLPSLLLDTRWPNNVWRVAVLFALWRAATRLEDIPDRKEVLSARSNCLYASDKSV